MYGMPGIHGINNSTLRRLVNLVTVPVEQKGSDECLKKFNLNSRSKRLASVIAFVKETQANCLKLRGRNIERSEAVLIFKALEDSHILEIDFGNNNEMLYVLAGNGNRLISKLLVRTKVRIFNVSSCWLTNGDLVELLEVLKDTEITELDVSRNHIVLDATTVDSLASFLARSHITTLNLACCKVSREAAAPLFQCLVKTSITQLNLANALWMPQRHITVLFSNLPLTAITDLNLSYNDLSGAQFEQLHESLRCSKLEKLELSHNRIYDNEINSLVRALVNSKVTKLNLSFNRIFGRNNLGHNLQFTQIKSLDLGNNDIVYDDMFNFPDFLGGSSVRSLSLNDCQLHENTVQKILESLALVEMDELFMGGNNFKIGSVLEFFKYVNRTSIISVNFSHSLHPDLSLEELSIIGDCLKDSKLERITLNRNESTFLHSLVKNLPHTSLTHIDLGGCKLSSEDVLSLGAVLKDTAISNLKLNNTFNLEVEDLKAFAECLIGTQVIKLNISYNEITNEGIVAFADVLKDTNLLNLNLRGNPIEDYGYYYLAVKISLTFITILSVDKRFESFIAFDGALWEQRKKVQQLIDCFSRIAPALNDNNFQFDRDIYSADPSSLLKACLFLYKTFLERPSLVYVLAHEKSICHSKSQITDLMLEEFPKQFAMFVGRSIEADVSEHIDLLKQVEDQGLSRITEFLLLNRPVYVIDEDQDILHPYVYILMHRFKQMIVSSAIEPRGKDKIIKYFTEHKELKGASELILLLRQSANGSAGEEQVPTNSKYF